MKAYKKAVVYVLTGIAAVSTAGCIATYLMYASERQKAEELAVQLAALGEQEKRTAVMQSMNAQMEEIATQQQRISEEQREEAVQQTIIANEMRENAEEQQRQAEEERRNAQEAERRAVEASNVAKNQRQIAEQRQHQAEYSRRVADTLSYLSMARSLASVATTQYQTGNKELASLLSYAAYNFTKRYHGDVYHMAIYQSLSITSESSSKWAMGKGAIMKEVNMDDGSILTVSKYGELMSHKRNRKGLKSRTILSDSRYDFRDLYVDAQGCFYALSNTGHMLIGKDGHVTVLTIEGATRPFRIFSHEKNKLVITAEKSVHVYDIATKTMKKTISLPFRTTIGGEDINHIYLFSETGKMYDIGNDGTHLQERKLPFKAIIMSYTYSIENGIEAFGTVDGAIYLIDKKKKISKLIGHSSRVSRVKFDGHQLFSSSYDGTIKFWNFQSAKIEPITILNTNQWVISFVFDKTKKFIYTGDNKGNFTETLISPELMADKIHGNMKRNLTKQEWEYYIGKNIPYESFVGKEGKR